MKSTVLLVAVMAGMLGLAAVVAVTVWDAIGDVPIGPLGLLAMGFGVLATLGLGIGLMRLAYLSERRENDDS